MKRRQIALFASGSGTNAENIINYFADNQDIIVRCLYSNKPGAYALVRAARLGIETITFTREEFYQSDEVRDSLFIREVDLIVLAGFLWLVPGNLLDSFPVINIHPALLPGYGGKNMYGDRVHEAVIRNGEKESGITIHYVNEKYDEGAIIFQTTCVVEPSDTPETLAAKIHQLEYYHYPRIIEQVAGSISCEVK